MHPFCFEMLKRDIKKRRSNASFSYGSNNSDKISYNVIHENTYSCYAPKYRVSRNYFFAFSKQIKQKFNIYHQQQHQKKKRRDIVPQRTYYVTVQQCNYASRVSAAGAISARNRMKRTRGKSFGNIYPNAPCKKSNTAANGIDIAKAPLTYFFICKNYKSIKPSSVKNAPPIAIVIMPSAREIMLRTSPAIAMPFPLFFLIPTAPRIRPTSDSGTER